MASQDATKNALAARAGTVANSTTKPQSIKDWITAMEPEIKKALPAVITPERFTRMALTAINKDPKLGECTPKSFMAALMTAAQLGLEPNTPLGQAYLIPYKNNRAGVSEVQFQVGYKGLIELAHRSGQFQTIMAHPVHQNDKFEYEYGLEPKLVHKPTLDDRGPVIAYYAMYKLTNGGNGFVVMSMRDVEAHRKQYSKADRYGTSPWQTNFDAMAQKTVLKQLLKYAPISVEFARNMAEDGAIRSDIEPNMTDVPQANVFEAGPDDYETVEEAPAKEEGVQVGM